ncbi:innexin inx2-like [Contarinia nasturtii]|uniref:innexin inx2-like n=1 Tax=Contarinia nasturtii TaxID=265458 RepID=UPI0012D3759E|nr:innexin inx2-like [Contarinia nasturtii]
MDFIGHLRRFIHPNKICIANNIFDLSTKATLVIFAALSTLLTSYQYLGAPILCVVDRFPVNVMQTYCWFYGTYTLPNSLLGDIGKHIIEPGVASEGSAPIKYHRYYQWVCLALFGNAIFSYLPRFLWKTVENGRMKKLCADLNNPTIGMDKIGAKKVDDKKGSDNKEGENKEGENKEVDEKKGDDKPDDKKVDGNKRDSKKKVGIKEKRLSGITTYFTFYLNRHSSYAYYFFGCELLNFAIAIAQIYFTHLFLDGQFLNYGIDVMLNQKVKPMTQIFPKVTKCFFHKYGPSGGIQKYDALCVLAINILNEKIYLFLWFWFVGIVFLSGIALVYRAFVCCSAKIRLHLLISFRARFAPRDDIEYILRHFDVADWFVLYQMSKNIDSVIFEEICHELKLMLESDKKKS